MSCPYCVQHDDPDRDVRCASQFCPSRVRSPGFLPGDTRLRARGADDEEAPRRGPWALGDATYRAVKARATTRRLQQLAQRQAVAA